MKMALLWENESITDNEESFFNLSKLFHIDFAFLLWNQLSSV